MYKKGTIEDYNKGKTVDKEYAQVFYKTQGRQYGVLQQCCLCFVVLMNSYKYILVQDLLELHLLEQCE